MTPDTVIGLGQEALKVISLISAPALLSVLVIGVIVGMFQAATSINEMTLSFVPKLILLAIVLAIAGPWMLSTIVDFTVRIFEMIPDIVS